MRPDRPTHQFPKMKWAGFKIVLERKASCDRRYERDKRRSETNGEHRIDGRGAHKRKKSNHQNKDGVEPNRIDRCFRVAIDPIQIS